MSILDVKFTMNKTSDILHSKLAHLFPLLGDVVSDYQSARNCLTIYGETPKDDSDYSNPKEFFEKILEFMQDLESLCHEAYVLSLSSEDIITLSFIQKFSRLLIPVTAQCLLLADKAETYKGDWMKFDHDIDDFIILKDFNSETKKWVN
jgi:hypothetical protein